MITEITVRYSEIYEYFAPQMLPQNVDIWAQNINIWPQNIDIWPQNIDIWRQNHSVQVYFRTFDNKLVFYKEPPR